jgi:hypothetical protein
MAFYLSEVPGVYAFLAILVSQHDRICRHDQGLAGGSGRLRMLHFYRSVLGQDFERVLLRKIRNHLRNLLVQLMTEAGRRHDERRERIAEEKQKEQEGDENVNIGGEEESDSESFEGDYEYSSLSPENRDYLWLFFQLRIFLLAYSLLEDFVLSLEKDVEPMRKTITAGKPPDNSALWPLVCLH